MNRLIGQTIKIVNLETFVKYRYKVLINILVLILMIGFQFYDITVQISSNYFVVSWIAFNTYYVFSIFNKRNREVFLHISYLTKFNKIFMQYAVAMIMNFLWFVFIFLQLIFVMKSHIYIALLIALIDVVFGIALGSFAGVLRKNIGPLLIVCLTLFNFIAYNPLVYSASSHFLSISEQLHSINQINYINICSLLILSITLITVVCIIQTSSISKKFLKTLITLSLMILLYSSLIYIDFSQYEKKVDDEFLNYTYDDNHILYKSITREDSEKISKLINCFENKYRLVQSDYNFSVYIIEKKFLSKMSWFLKNEQPELVELDDQTIYFNIVSNSMINFENATFSRNLMKELQISFTKGVEGYSNTKYSRHLVDGFSIAILHDISSNLDFKNANEIEKYFDEYVSSMKEIPANKYNYIKRIAIEVYEKYPDQIELLYNRVISENPNNGHEFLLILEKDFTEIFDDIEVQKIIKEI